MHTNFWVRLLIGVCDFCQIISKSSTQMLPLSCGAVQNNLFFSFLCVWPLNIIIPLLGCLHCGQESLDPQCIFHRLWYFIFERTSICFGWIFQFIFHPVFKWVSYFPVRCLHSQHWGKKIPPKFNLCLPLPFWTIPCEVDGIAVKETETHPGPCKPSIISQPVISPWKIAWKPWDVGWG